MHFILCIYFGRGTNDRNTNCGVKENAEHILLQSDGCAAERERLHYKADT